MTTPEELQVQLAIARQDADNLFELANRYRRDVENSSVRFWYAVVMSSVLGAIVGAITKALT